MNSGHGQTGWISPRSFSGEKGTVPQCVQGGKAHESCGGGWGWHLPQREVGQKGARTEWRKRRPLPGAALTRFPGNEAVVDLPRATASRSIGTSINKTPSISHPDLHRQRPAGQLPVMTTSAVPCPGERAQPTLP